MRIIVMIKAQGQLNSLPTLTRDRIYRKLRWYLEQEDPIIFADKLTDSKLGEYRYRIGDYRVIFDIDGELIIVNKVGLRKEIHR